MANILTIAANVEYLTTQRTISESKIEYDRYSDTIHHNEHSKYSDALAVVNDASNVPSPCQPL